MEAVLCSKKRTDDYLWVINKVYVQILRPSYLYLYWSPWGCSRLILIGIKRASDEPRTEALIMAVFEILAI